MAQLTITVPDAQIQRLLTAFKGAYGYEDFLPGATPIPNPETPVQFTRRMIRVYMMDVLRAFEATQAAEAARLAAAAAVDSEVTMT